MVPPGLDRQHPAAVDVTLLRRFYERFGDHTVVVGRRVIFLITGE
jgi:phosphate transport system protein